MRENIRLLACAIVVFFAAACANRTDPGADQQPTPQPQVCKSDGDCVHGPTACHIGSCSQGTCSYMSSCVSGETCNARNLCEAPPPPPPTTGNGTISCAEQGAQTHVTIGSGILSRLFDTSIVPDSNWSVAMIDGYAVERPWSSDNASYALVMPRTISAFTLAVKEPGGRKHWFDVSKFDVSGTCARGTGQFTHSTSTPPPTTGNGTISCAEQGTQTYVTVSNGILAHVFNQNGFTAASLRFGYGLSDWESWVSDSASYVLTMPSTTTEFNLFVRDTAGVDHWFDVNQFNVSGTCAKITGAFTHTVQSVGNGSISCSESGSNTNVTVSNGILPHVFNQNGFTAASLRFGYGLSDWESWVSDSASYVLTMPSTTTEFNLFVRDTAGVDHWFDVNQFNVSGTCAKITGAFTHTVQSVGNGSISCSESGSNTNVTVSGGILAHLNGTPGTPSLLQFAYGGSQTLSWNGDGASYTFTMGNSITNFNFQLRDVNAHTYAFDVTEFNVSGTCSKTSISFTHTVSAVTNVGTIKCRLWDVGGTVKREVTITPNTNGIIAGTFQEGTPVTSPESIRLNVDGQQQTWVGNGQAYIFYPAVSVNDFNFFVVDNDDVANGGDTVSGGDWFNLAAWTVTNETTQHGASNCHVSGGGISIN